VSAGVGRHERSGALYFDVPVYRLKEDWYYAELHHYVENTLFRPRSPDAEALREMDKRNPEENAGVRSRFERLTT